MWVRDRVQMETRQHKQQSQADTSRAGSTRPVHRGQGMGVKPAEEAPQASAPRPAPCVSPPLVLRWLPEAFQLL